MLYQKGIYKLKFMIMLAFALFCRCKYVVSYDVYSKIPKGSRLTKEIFLSSKQIIKYESDLILAFNICPNCWNRNDTHLLFYDKNLTLTAASFFSAGKVENIENGVITGYLNEDRFARSGSYRNDLPPKYSLKLTKWQSGNGRKSDKIIQKIVLDNNNMNVKIIVKKCIDNIYIGMNIIEGSGKIDSFFLTNFTKLDTISCRVSDISFFEDSISLETINSYNYQIDDMMIVTDTSVLTLFYDQLWKQITVISKSNK